MSADRLISWGWILFAVSGIFFLADALESGDLTSLAAAISWLVGVALFMAANRHDR
ncbi:MAG: hypothetical protein ACR2P0_07000 [Acidimicrobiales bacterium]